MPAPLQLLGIGHVNHLTSGFDETAAHYADLLGGQYLMRIGENAYTDGYLIDVGGEIIEALIPKVLDKAEGRQLTKLGPHYSSIELLVADLEEARAAVKSRGIGLLLEGHGDFLTKAADTEGVILQIYAGDWKRVPRPERFVADLRTAEWWRDVHPIGYTGLRHVSIATDDLDRSLAFWVELTGGTELYREARPDATAKAAGVDIGIPVELIAPTGDGPIGQFIARYGTKIRAVTHGVQDLGRTERYFASKGVTLVPGDLPDSLMLRAEDNRGAILQFVE